ncbi:MAG: 16S rRNA (guanine(966)-N(2))-methyltransferase RsmD [Paraglaciecola polaris]|uniref:16S rRNA (guanine(966)-N(2))-methyltransferase RsmD n=1 Tax=Paraglaciecola polaris TaxID=222814 RepID=UPI003001713E|tara:strand:+ start:4115 stop:4699 length:585 start_codon:yes stop_codon:yes gene_type:complete
MKRDVKKTQAANGAIRIISGQWRGRKLPVMDVQGLRPTTDRNKETLFNWLMPYTQNSRCLDAFAGSGGLGFEALSRYAKHVTFIELDKKVAANLRQNLANLKAPQESAEVICADTLGYLMQLQHSFELIFLDPPFHKNLLPGAIDKIQQQGLLAENGLVYIECETANAQYAVPLHWRLLKENQSSQVTARLYQG